MQIFKSYANLLNPGIRQIPASPQLDRTHPLTRGMIFCHAPGVAVNELTGFYNQTAPVNQHISELTAEGNASNSAPGVSTTGTQMAVYSTLTAYFRSYVKGTVPAFGNFFGNSFSNPNVSPFLTWEMQMDATPTNWQAIWNTAGVGTQLAGNAPGIGLLSICTTFTVNGNVVLYRNGLQINTGAFGASAPTVGSGGQSLIGTTNANSKTLIAAAWNRILTTAEIMWLHVEPYSFLQSAEGDLKTKPASLLQTHFRFRTDTDLVDNTPAWGDAEDAA